MSTIAELAREHDVVIPLVGYVPTTEERTITAPADHPLWETDPDEAARKDLYLEGDAVEPFDMVGAHLRIAAAYRTTSGKISAEARRASVELARRKTNRPVKAARKTAIAQALSEAGLL